eukprot:820929_1
MTWIRIKANQRNKIIGCFYNSPNRGLPLIDEFKIIENEIIFIYKQHPKIDLFMMGDWNLMHPSFAATTQHLFPANHMNAYEILSDICVRYAVELINSDRIATHKKGNVLDLIFASTKHRHRYFILENRLSDHHAIFVDFEHQISIRKSNDNARIHNIHWNFYRPINHDEYVQNTSNQLHDIQRHNKNCIMTNTRLDIITIRLLDTINNNATHSIGKTRHSNHIRRKAWVTPEIIKLSIKKKRILKRIRKSNKYRDKQRFRRIYKQLVQDSRNLCKAARSQYIANTSIKTNNGSQNIHQTIRNLQNMDKHNRNEIPFLYDPYTKLEVFDDGIKANLFANKFCHQNKTFDYEAQRTLDDIHTMPCINPLIYPDCTPGACTIRNPKLHYDIKWNHDIKTANESITIHELNEAAKSIKANKHHGPGIHWRLINDLEFRQFFLWYFNHIFDAGYFPQMLKKSFIFPKQKPRKDGHQIASYREINCCGAIRKWIELVILHKLMKFILSQDCIDIFNFANLKGKCPADAINVLINDIRNNFTKYTPTYAVTSDIKGCYPSVNLSIKIERIQHYYGIRGKMVNALASILLNNWTSVVVNGSLSLWMIQMIGLRQGSPLSPILSLLYLNPIYMIIYRHPRQFGTAKMILWVDDLIIWIKLHWPYVQYIQVWMQELIDAITTWLQLNNMRLSFNKTFRISFCTNTMMRYRLRNIIQPFVVNLYGDTINETSTIRYLGTDIAYDLSPTQDIISKVTKINRQMHIIKRSAYLIRNQLLNIHLVRLMEQTLIASMEYNIVFLYNASERQLAPLSKIYHNYLRYISGAAYSTSITILTKITQMLPLKQLIHYHCICTFQRYLHTNAQNEISNVIECEWYPQWRQYSSKYPQIATRHTQQRQHILWQIFKLAFQYYDHRLDLLDFTTYHKERACKKSKHPKYITFSDISFTDTDLVNYSDRTVYSYSDGGIKHNIGAISMYIETHHLSQSHIIPYDRCSLDNHTQIIGRQYDINLVELEGILRSCQMIIRSNLSNITNLHIISDNINAIHWCDYQPCTLNIILIICIKQIHQILKQIHEQNGIHITMQWSKRNTCFGITWCDQHVKQILRVTCKSIPPAECFPSVDLPGKLYRKELKKCMIHAMPSTRDHVISTNLSIWRDIHWNFKLESKVLTHMQIKHLTLLRTQHNPLNYSQHILRHYNQYKSQQISNGYHRQHIKCTRCCAKFCGGRCKHCIDKYEDESHMILKCPHYQQDRMRLLYVIEPLYITYNVKICLKSLLFPPEAMRWRHRKLIIQSIANFAIATKRFLTNR